MMEDLIWECKNNSIQLIFNGDKPILLIKSHSVKS
jgi:hypothetical protein